MTEQPARVPSSNKNQYDPHSLPDFDVEFISQDDLDQFAEALNAPAAESVTALNDWRPIHQKVKKTKRRKLLQRSKDETREGFVYTILRYPLLLIISGWIVFLFIAYNLTRLYIYGYEHFVTWTGKRERIRRRLHEASSYDEWASAAQAMDVHLGNEDWKSEDAYSYYNHDTVRKVNDQLKELQERSIREETANATTPIGLRAIDDLKALLESCIKNNFVGVENARLYSESYLGTKHLVQDFVDRTAAGLHLVLDSEKLTLSEKSAFFRSLELNYGRMALCLSGGATFAYYHFGVIKALLEANELPEIITGTSGGALVAALVATRTEEELKQLLVPALAYRIRACQDSFSTWVRRCWRTGARFDYIEWGRQCGWFSRGSMTFKEAYERTGRILNVSCVPSDPHSPTILNNHITSPDCVIWSAVLASAAVPGILNPIVLMRKKKDGTLIPYSFGNIWKDGSLRTDIPLKALNIHFNVNFSIVSQVNPHINLFFFSPRGSPGRQVTHTKGRGWRGGFLGSSLETSIKLDMQKYLKILKHLELLPRPLGQDWSELWLQKFSGSVTIWPKTVMGDFWNILSDPDTKRLERMILAGQRSCWPRIRFIANRQKIERPILEGLRRALPRDQRTEIPSMVLVQQNEEARVRLRRRIEDSSVETPSEDEEPSPPQQTERRQSNILEELSRQASVLWQEDELTDFDEDAGTTTDEGENNVARNGEVKVV